MVQVGSGTDPGEGAALAGALLDKLADTAGLTYATTHHAQLKDRPVSPCSIAACLPLTTVWIFVLLLYQVTNSEETELFMCMMCSGELMCLGELMCSGD